MTEPHEFYRDRERALGIDGDRWNDVVRREPTHRDRYKSLFARRYGGGCRVGLHPYPPPPRGNGSEAQTIYEKEVLASLWPPCPSIIIIIIKSTTLAAPPFTIHGSLKRLHLDRFRHPHIKPKMSETQTATQAAATEPTATQPTAAEATTTPPAEEFPGDSILAGAETVYDSRKTISAGPEDVWPWLVQWGKGRGGWYVPSKFEKVLPEKYRSAPAINQEWQALKVGDSVPDYAPLGGKKSGGKAAQEDNLEVAVVEEQRALVYKGERLGLDFTWALLLEPAGEGETVLHLRFRGKSQQPGWKGKVALQVGKVADGVLASAMLPGIVDRAEAQKNVRVSA